MSIQTMTEQLHCRVYFTAIDRVGNPLSLVWEGKASSADNASEKVRTKGLDYGFIDLSITEIRFRLPQGEKIA